MALPREAPIANGHNGLASSLGGGLPTASQEIISAHPKCRCHEAYPSAQLAAALAAEIRLIAGQLSSASADRPSETLHLVTTKLLVQRLHAVSQMLEAGHE